MNPPHASHPVARAQARRAEPAATRNDPPRDGAVRRYHPALAALHWLLAALLVVQAWIGLVYLTPLSDLDPDKVDVARLHMAMGITIVSLMLLRLFVRLGTKRPPIPEGKPGLRGLALANHWMLYLAVFALGATGLGMALTGGFLSILWSERARLPNLEALGAESAHEYAAIALGVLFSLHLAGNFYHFIRREKLLARMWFGDRRHIPPGPDLHSPDLPHR